MSFRISQVESADREAFAGYRYRIEFDGRFFAWYRHDFRGEEHDIEFADGTREDWPVGRVMDFIDGGGPQPPRLTDRAIAYLSTRVG